MSKHRVSFNKKIIKKHLLPSTSELDIELYKSVGSTNDLIKAELSSGRNKVIIASHQTGGRGRMGRSFYSPKGCGIYMSILLHIDQNASSSLLLTSASAVAVAEAIDKICGVNAEIKWVNDVFVNGKKVAGILCEAKPSDKDSASSVIVGIGINLISPKGFPDELCDIASSVCGKKLKSARLPSILCAEIINNLFKYASSLSEREFTNEYKKRLFVIGKEVSVISAEQSYPATVCGIDDYLRLIVKTSMGEERLLSFGEISIKI